jgi:hypothetical protein
MAPLNQYLMPRDTEIALARSAAPDSIARDAEMMVLSRRGYETAVQGKNGFVCMVWRSWAAKIDDPDFWNPKLRAPICLNAPASHHLSSSSKNLVRRHARSHPRPLTPFCATRPVAPACPECRWASCRHSNPHSLIDPSFRLEESLLPSSRPPRLGHYLDGISVL